MENIINQLIAIENKANEQHISIFNRNFKRLTHEFETLGYRVVNPIGEKYDYRDASLEVNILNEEATTITKVIKPTIYKLEGENFVLIQKGIVIVA